MGTQTLAPLAALAARLDPRSWTFAPRALVTDARCLQGMSWRRVGWLGGVALGFAAFSMLGHVIRDGGMSRPLQDATLEFSGWFVRYFVEFTPVLVAMTVADNLPWTGAPRVVALCIALVLGAQFQWPILCATNPWMESGCEAFPAQLWRSWTELLGDNTAWTIAFSTPIALAYFFRRRDTRTARALHAAELARADVQRRTLAADLQTMQARVEPAFLFDTLGEIGDLLDRDHARGERMLDGLIAYLRATLPDMRASQSTLGREAAIAGAWLSIVALRAGGRVDAAVGVPPSLAHVAFPPMMLLPLLTAVVGGGIASPASTTTLRVDATVAPGRVRVQITGRGPALRDIAGTDAVRGVRERLRALHGGDAALTVDGAAGRHVDALLEVPRETA